jgi:transcriptional regulator with PAS, ATPase and Fis domain
VLKRAADSDFPIVITGESGTGKEMFAHAIHNHSHRSEGPFIPLNCAAIPKDLLESELFGYDEGAFTGAKRGGNPGKFELADGGTIFLDEIDSMPLDMQAKLLRLIEEKRVLRLGGKGFIPVDIRIISASNKDLLERIAEGAFRDDLYFRLNVVSVSLPPLRERPGDIPLLARHFIGKYTKSAGEAERLLTPEILESLQSYEWPGNARELSNWVERLLALGNDGASGVDVPVSIGETRTGEVPKSAEARRATLHEGEASYMKTLIVEAIKRNHGVMSKAASDLGISRSTLYRRIARHGIEF